MAGALYLVATPIGNLGDITLRAIETLKSVDLIACEDTRHTLGLLTHLGIQKRLISYHKHNERQSAQRIIDELLTGANVALVSDAGMPCISDPGAVVVSLARQAGIRITAIPGASAAVTAIALSGMEADGFVFLGFLYGTDSQKKNRLAQYAKERLPLVIYSAPHDIKEELKLASEILGKRKICIIKEMTKIYESVDCGILGELQAQNEKGEFVLIIEGFSEEQVCTDEDIIKELTELLQMGVSKKDASAIAARHLNVAKKRAYDLCKNL